MAPDEPAPVHLHAESEGFVPAAVGGDVEVVGPRDGIVLKVVRAP